MNAASLDDTKKAIDAAGKASGFRCVPVSWEDAQRTNNPFGGGLSSGGPNIADVRLYEKTGRLLYTLRSENWNERLGYVSSADVTLVTGNESGSSVQSSVSLAAYLQSAGTYGSYVGLQSPSLYAPGVDEIFSIRFQAVFLPVSDPGFVDRAFGMTGAPRATTEFCTEVYSYNTRSDAEPRNMLLLATPQGTSMQQDGARAQRLYYHSVDGNGAVQRFWLEAEQSDHKVGGAQTETAEEALEAAMRGKAVAVRIGPLALGTRFNVQMLIQVPLAQCRAPPSHSYAASYGLWLEDQLDDVDMKTPKVYSMPEKRFRSRMTSVVAKRVACEPRVGTSNAARVSRGSLQDTYPGLASKTPQREPSMHGTITVTLYYTVIGGVPSVEDVHRCVADLDALYKSLPSDKRLVQCHEVTHNPFQSKALPHPGTPQPTLPPSTTSSVRCPNGHFLAKHTASTAPANGYNCDTCGNFYAVGEQVGYGCRHCDFDTCVKCHDLGPRCAHNAPLVPIPVASLQATPYRQCTGCGKHTASHVGSMYGCHCGAGSLGGKTLLCIHCYLQKVVAAKMSA